jgi:DNA-binding beta-propeller fold protein YncE
MNFPKGIAVDPSGNVWVANSGVTASVTGGVNANSVTELVGVATPVQTPLAAGLTGGSGNTPAKKP